MIFEGTQLTILIIVGSCIASTVLSILIFFKGCDNTTETIFNRLYFLKSMPIGLNPSSTRQMIGERSEQIRWSKALHSMLTVDSNNSLVDSNGNTVDLHNIRTNEAVLVIHGITNTPIQMKSIIDHFINKNQYDVYGSLLLYHGRTVKELTQVNKEAMLNQIKLDIEYLLDLGYEKVYCIGHSFAGASLVDLSLQNAFGANSSKVKLILYAPAVVPTVTWFQRNVLAYPLVNVKKYLTLNLEVDYMSGFLDNRNYSLPPFYVFTRALILRTMELADDIKKRISSNQKLNNDFGLLLLKNDKSVEFAQTKSVLIDSSQPKCRSFSALETGGHQAHMSQDPNVYGPFFQAIDNAMSQLSSV